MDSEWQWHQLGYMQICTSPQTDNHASIPPLSSLQAGCPSCHPTNSVKALKAVVYCVIFVKIWLTTVLYGIVMQTIWCLKFWNTAKSGGQFALASPHCKFWGMRPPVTYTHASWYPASSLSKKQLVMGLSSQWLHWAGTQFTVRNHCPTSWFSVYHHHWTRHHSPNPVLVCHRQMALSLIRR